MKPVLFVTGHAPAYRIGALTALHEREHIELALFGGRLRHGGPAAQATAHAPFRVRHVAPRELYALAASGRYRAVVCPTAGRLAPLATWAGARRSRTALILWASLWAHPRTPAHALSYLPLRHLYASADAVVTYGEHVSSYVRARGARNVFVAAQSVDNDFWGAASPSPPSTPSSSPSPSPAARAGWPRGDPTRFLFVGRAEREKGLHVLLDAWVRSSLRAPDAELVLVGAGLERELAQRAARPEPPRDVHALGSADRFALRAIYAACDVLVVPSIATRTFREPWGLVVNEAMNSGLPVIASDAVGAAAGGLVRDGETGLILAAGDAGALSRALTQLAASRQLRERMGAAGALAVRAFSHAEWARGFSRALESLALAREDEGAGSVRRSQ